MAEEAEVAEAEADDFHDETFRIPISKAGDKESPAFLEVTFKEIMNNFPGVSLKKLLVDGLKVHLNSRMQKITGEKTAGSKASAKEIAEANLANLREGKVNAPAAKSDAKVPQEVKVEAERLAKAAVKAKIKQEGKVKVSHVAAKVITAAAKLLLANEKGQSIWEMAKKNIAERKEAEASIGIDLGSIKEDPKLKAKVEAEAAKKKKAAAEKKAAKAGKTVTPKAKPKAEQHATH